MTKWEYCRIEILNSAKNHNMRNALFFMGTERVLTNINIPQMVSQLGKEGWELVSHTSTVYPDRDVEYIFYFKRPIENDKND